MMCLSSAMSQTKSYCTSKAQSTSLATSVFGWILQAGVFWTTREIPWRINKWSGSGSEFCGLHRWPRQGIFIREGFYYGGLWHGRRQPSSDCEGDGVGRSTAFGWELWTGLSALVAGHSGQVKVDVKWSRDEFPVSVLLVPCFTYSFILIRCSFAFSPSLWTVGTPVSSAKLLLGLKLTDTVG